MTGAELIAILQDPAVREPVQRLLGVPSEPVAEALKELSAAQRATDVAVKEFATDVKELAAAQRATDAAVKGLADEVKELAAGPARDRPRARRTRLGLGPEGRTTGGPIARAEPRAKQALLASEPAPCLVRLKADATLA